LRACHPGRQNDQYQQENRANRYAASPNMGRRLCCRIFRLTPLIYSKFRVSAHGTFLHQTA
jgi:hypothetical protein